MSETWPFSFEIDVHGAVAIADKQRLHPASLSEEQIDTEIGRLKECLDQVATQMKQAVKVQNDKDVV